MKLAFLTVIAGAEAGRRYVLRLGQRFTIGRGQSVTIPVDDGVVSRRHAEVELGPDGLIILDLGSRNGTLVDERRLGPGEAARLPPGALVRVGATTFEVALRDDEDDDEATRSVFLPTVPPEFEVLGLLGRGATGVVYAARQKVLGRRVAIKVPRLDAAADEAQVNARFLREARLQCLVASPFVVGVHDIRQVGDRTYLILELVHGYSARDRLASGPLPLHEALRIGEFTAMALDAVHRARVVHRDVKPANILLTVEGAVKLSDFGIAKALDDPTDLEPLTGSGEGMGTLCYVAPEQLTDARRVDARADIYGLGATLYHLVAGRPRLEPGTPVDEAARRLREGPPRLREVCDCPHEVAELIQHLLEPHPEDRPASAADLAVQLRERWQPLFASSRVTSLSEGMRSTRELPLFGDPGAQVGPGTSAG